MLVMAFNKRIKGFQRIASLRSLRKSLAPNAESSASAIVDPVALR